MKFPALVQNEIIKIHSKRQSVLFVYFCSVFIVGIGIANWLLPDLRAGLDYLEFAYQMYSFLTVFVMLFAVVLGSQSVTDEFKDGTIKQLLLRPVSRTTILLSKYAANLVVILLTFLLLYIISIILDIVLFGTSKAGDVTLWTLSKLYLYGLPDAFFMMTLSFFISTVFKSSALAITVSIVLNIAGEVLSAILPNDWEAKYIVFANLNLRLYDSDPLLNGGMNPPFPGMSLGFSIAVILAYIVLLLLIEIAVFEKQDIY